MLGRVDKPRSEIRILEHGFGSGSALLYLLALGFIRIHGIDLGGPDAALNRIAAAAGLAAPPFAIYRGPKLPYADGSFDFVFSQQVLEHVAPAVIDAYYAEEARVLVPGGLAYHQVPHRLVPYDSHTRTWFVHYLPRPIAHRVYRMLGRDSEVAREHLFLRMPGFHRRQMRLHFGHCLDVTDGRLRRLKIEGYYDGPARVRNLVGKLVNMPVLGAAATALLKNLLMIDTLSIKQGRPGAET
jgi:SAM-dependent methyltransferase